jgi:hypothetical protein
MPISTTGIGIGMGPGSRRRQGQGGWGQNGCSPGDRRQQPQDIAFPPRSAARTLAMTPWTRCTAQGATENHGNGLAVVSKP